MSANQHYQSAAELVAALSTCPLAESLKEIVQPIQDDKAFAQKCLVDVRLHDAVCFLVESTLEDTNKAGMVNAIQSHAKFLTEAITHFGVAVPAVPAVSGPNEHQLQLQAKVDMLQQDLETERVEHHEAESELREQLNDASEARTFLQTSFDALGKEQIELREELKTFKATNIELREELKTFKATDSKLHQELDALKAENSELREELEFVAGTHDRINEGLKTQLRIMREREENDSEALLQVVEQHAASMTSQRSVIVRMAEENAETTEALAEVMRQLVQARSGSPDPSDSPDPSGSQVQTASTSPDPSGSPEPSDSQVQSASTSPAQSGSQEDSSSPDQSGSQEEPAASSSAASGSIYVNNQAINSSP